MPIILRTAACTAVLLIVLTCAPEEKRPSTENAAPLNELLDISAVTGLLDLLDTIVVHNPATRDINIRFATASPEEQQLIVDSLTRHNRDDAQINTQIDALLSLPAYQLYYAQFRNMTPEKHREIFLHLPIQAINSPADIAGNVMDLLIHRKAVRAWINDVVDSIDLNRSDRIARDWLPAGDYTMPQIHFVYDGNGDAFARDGAVGFDLYGIVFSKRPTNTRFFDLASVGVGDIEGVIAHEMQHTYAEPLLYPPGQTFDSWQDEMIDHITRRFVSEGIAMQCDQREGLRRTIKEDTNVVRYWIGHLNAKFAALKSGTIDQDAFQNWYRASYHDSARVALEIYAKHAHPDVDLRQFVAEHIIDRPSFDYTLGWWMIAHILEHDGKETVLGLLSDPTPLFELYNNSLPPAEAGLKAEFSPSG